MKYILSIFLLAILLGGCSKKAKYDQWVQSELASGVQQDSLFLGLHLGMTSKDFFAHCWELNRKGLVRQGPSNMSVEYKLENELKYPATMNFYPSFQEDKIYEMPVIFRYQGWSPWNRHLQSDSLQVQVLKLMQDWYGEEFMQINHSQHGPAYVRIDGNRRISIFNIDEKDVEVMFTDLSQETEEPAS